jgi:hypothetical protein
MSVTLNRNIGTLRRVTTEPPPEPPHPRTCPPCLAQVATPTLLRGPPQLAASFIFIPLPRCAKRRTSAIPSPRIAARVVSGRSPSAPALARRKLNTARFPSCLGYQKLYCVRGNERCCIAGFRPLGHGSLASRSDFIRLGRSRRSISSNATRCSRSGLYPLLLWAI